MYLIMCMHAIDSVMMKGEMWAVREGWGCERGVGAVRVGWGVWGM